ncbi:hypothetical protein B0A80_06460 [Flavobacterium tructae]|uniref:hypothetical protein n=1 Tax=Flavobacterium tructae TaxID=1114873 RepID=UPI000B5C12A4|nr:hypothetical protein [Flavobacterium tructae]OXB24328.1 hypothetical protein B0A80_06460 [Flavobacterium tructae]
MPLSKQRKTEILIFIFLILIGSSFYLNFKNIHIKFYNKTGENIDSLVIGKNLIGNLKNNNSTKHIDFKEFAFDGNIPYEQISGRINNKNINQLYWSWCGTNHNKKSEGSYIFDIKKGLDEKGNPCLYLTNHNEKMFWE